MTRAKEKAERLAKAITIAITARAGQALRSDGEQEFRELYAACDVGLRFEWTRFQDGVKVESDLFSSACYGITIRKKSDLAKLVIERMIAEGIDLKTHRADTRFGFTPLMMASACCDMSVLAIVLPLSNLDAITSHGFTALELARDVGKEENAQYIESFILSRQETEIFNEIPVPVLERPRPRQSIDDR